MNSKILTFSESIKKELRDVANKKYNVPYDIRIHKEGIASTFMAFTLGLCMYESIKKELREFDYIDQPQEPTKESIKKELRVTISQE